MHSFKLLILSLLAGAAMVALAACSSSSSSDNGSDVLAVPGAPTGLAAVSEATQNTVSWSAPGSGGAVASYNLYWSNATGVTTASTKIASASTPYVHTGVTGGSQYCYSVSGVNAAGEGALSSEVCVTYSVAALTMQSYDDFSSGSFGRRLWNNVQNQSNKIVSGTLVSSVTSWDTGINNNVIAVNPASPVTSISADVTVTASQATGSSGTLTTSPRARVVGTFYHDGSVNSGAGDRRGDIGAVVTLQETQSTWAVFRCISSDCLSAMTLGNGTLSTGLTLNTAKTLSIAWTASSGQFSLSDGGTPATFDAATVGAAYKTAAHVPRVAVGTQTSGVTWAEMASVTATIDNVTVNGTLHDDFGAAALDLTKWRFAGSAEVVSGQATITQESSGPSADMALGFRHPDLISALAADVTVTSYSNNTDGTLRAQLLGQFYNDGTAGDGTGGRNGDVVASLGMSDTEIVYTVSTCANSDCSTLTTHVSQTLGAAITLGSTHRLELAYDGSQFIFRRDGILAATVTAPANVKSVQGGPFKALRTRTFGATTGGARITATFDNVSTNAGDAGLVGNGDFVDFFAGSVIDTNNWVFFSPEQWAEVNGGAMRAGLTTTSFSTSNNPQLNVASVPTDIQADAKITSATVVGGAEARARIAGTFFLNTSGNQVFAGIFITPTQARYFVVECSLTDCATNIPLASGVLGTAVLNTTYTLRIQYDGATTFIFTRGTDTKTIDVGAVSADVPRAVTFSATVANPFQAIGVQAQNVDWRESVHVEAEFDNVMINGSSYDTFGTEFDPTKWKTERFAKTVAGGALELSSRRSFGTGSTSSFVDVRTDDGLVFGADRIEAIITPTELSVTDAGTAGATAQVGVELYFQPDGPFYAGGGNRTGQTLVQLVMKNVGGTLQAVAIGFTCTDSSCSASSQATGNNVAFTTVPALSTAYTVVAARTGADTFGLTFGGQTLTLDFTGIAQFDAADFKFARVFAQTFSINDAGDVAAALATVDNVKVGNY